MSAPQHMTQAEALTAYRLAETAYRACAQLWGDDAGVTRLAADVVAAAVPDLVAAGCTVDDIEAEQAAVAAAWALLPGVGQLREVLHGYEQWEAAIITDRRCWGDDGMALWPRIGREHYRRLLELQKQRNLALYGDASGGVVHEWPETEGVT